MRDELKVWDLMGETSASIYPLAQAIMGAQFEKHFTEQRFYQPTFIAVQRTLHQRLFGAGFARAGGVRRGGVPPLARYRVSSASV